VTVVPAGDGALAQNTALAREAAIRAADILGRKLSFKTMTDGLKRVVLAGRSEIMPGPDPRVILDGAHNSEKLAVSVETALAKAGAGPRVCVLGLLSVKASVDTVAPLKNRFDQVVVTEPSVYAKRACPAEETASLLRQIGYKPVVERDEPRALDTAIGLAGEQGTVLVTGSFYLVGNLRNRWYPKEAVVLGRSSFAKSPETSRATPPVY
jgi:dihydrofolate synthase/folylpolyglutamate synthase